MQDSFKIKRPIFTTMKDYLFSSAQLKTEFEDALTKSDYYHLYNTSPDMFVSLNLNKKVKFCNETFAEKLGYSKKEIIGVEVYNFFDPSSFKVIKTAFQSFQSKGYVKNVELVLKNIKGKKIPILLNSQAVFDSNGNILYSNSCLRDISKLNNLQEQLAYQNKFLEEKVKERTEALNQKNKDLEHFVFAATHDLQEPIRTISSCVDLIKNEKDISAQEKYLNYISMSSNRMLSLIRGLLDYSKIGTFSNAKNINLTTLVENVISDLKNTIDEKEAIINLKTLPIINGMEVELRQLFQNLISNALKYTKKNTPPEVTIDCEYIKKDQYLFKIIDNGIGIQKGYLDEIFTLFKRLHGQDTYKGNGIGLAHCQKIVSLHKGIIWVKSSYGKGSTFLFTLSK